MGEKIKVLTQIKLGETVLDVELNHGTDSSGYREIHIQNPKLRLAMPETEFLQLATSVLLAKRQLELLKNKRYGGQE